MMAQKRRTFDDDERAYLTLIQATIARLADNSFQLKAWSVALGSVIIGLTAKDAVARYAAVALIPVIAFWSLDAYFLALERGYRRLFDAAAGEANAAPAIYDMHVGEISPTAWFQCLWRSSVCLTHGPIAGIALIVAFLGPGNLKTS